MKQLHNKILILLIIACIGSLQAAPEVIAPKDMSHNPNATGSHPTTSGNKSAIAAANEQAKNTPAAKPTAAPVKSSWLGSWYDSVANHSAVTAISNYLLPNEVNIDSTSPSTSGHNTERSLDTTGQTDEQPEYAMYPADQTSKIDSDQAARQSTQSAIGENITTPLANLAQATHNNLNTRSDFKAAVDKTADIVDQLHQGVSAAPDTTVNEPDTRVNEPDTNKQFESENLSPAMQVLYQTLRESQSLSDTFAQLAQKKPSKARDNPNRSAALTLLIRAHPELIEGLQAKLAYLPNRFVSYFKEQLPSLTTKSARQRFTQSIIVETLKAMTTDDFDSHGGNEPIINKKNEKLDENIQKIANLYTENLKNITDTEMLQYRSAMFQEWSRNMIIDISLCVTIPTFSLGGAIVGSAMGIPIGIGNGLIGEIHQRIPMYRELPIYIPLVDASIGAVGGAAYGAYQGAEFGAKKAMQFTPKKATLQQRAQSQQKKQKDNKTT